MEWEADDLHGAGAGDVSPDGSGTTAGGEVEEADGGGVRSGLAVAGLAHGTGAAVALAGGCIGARAAGCFWFEAAVGLAEVSGLEEFDEGRVIDGLVVHLSGFAGAEEEFLSAGEGDTEGFAGFVGDVHGGWELRGERDPS